MANIACSLGSSRSYLEKTCLGFQLWICSSTTLLYQWTRSIRSLNMAPTSLSLIISPSMHQHIKAQVDFFINPIVNKFQLPNIAPHLLWDFFPNSFLLSPLRTQLVGTYFPLVPSCATPMKTHLWHREFPPITVKLPSPKWTWDDVIVSFDLLSSFFKVLPSTYAN